ncbi:hypothetical protein [Listeria monocytogenes]|nr:hypothetical protein [Listeria monocytogenes]
MDDSSVKEYAYEQMKFIIEGRRGLTKQYYEWTEQLTLLYHSKSKYDL